MVSLLFMSLLVIPLFYRGLCSSDVGVVESVVHSPQPFVIANMIVGGVPAMQTSSIVTEKSTNTELSDMKTIYTDLFDTYNPLLRPRLNLQDTVEITTKFVPLTILDFDTRRQIFTISGYFQFEWKDEVLANGTSFNGTLRISPSKIWFPSVRIAKVTGATNVVGDKHTDFLGVRTNGSVQWVPEGIYSVICEVDITYFPFDVQTCTLTYYVEGETSSTVDLDYYDEVDLKEYIPNAEWNLISAAQQTRQVNNITYIDIHFKTERRGTFDALTIITPILMMSILSPFPFLLPISSGEKGTNAVMIYFGYTIFMTILNDSLPHNSLHLSHLVLLVLYLLSGSVFLIFYAIIQYRLCNGLQNGNCPVVCKTLLRKYMNKRGLQSDEIRFWEGIFTKIDWFCFVVFHVLNAAATSVFMFSLFRNSFSVQQ